MEVTTKTATIEIIEVTQSNKMSIFTHNNKTSIIKYLILKKREFKHRKRLRNKL